MRRADYSKIGRENFASIAPPDVADILITNRTANQEELESLVSQGIEVYAI